MRIGVAPSRAKQTTFRPEKVTAAVLVHIPSSKGYFAHRLEILQLCLKSLVNNAGQPINLLVFDNGSEPRVIEFLKELRAQGVIDVLILSRNLGKMAAVQLISRMKLGEFLAYSDDDIFFLPGWLDGQLAVLDAFPDAGLVSGWAIRSSFVESEQLHRLASEGAVYLEETQNIPDEWETDFAKSTGRDPEVHLASVAGMKEVTITRDGVRAYPAGTHFQFIARSQVLAEHLPDELSTWFVAKDESMLDEAMERAGYLSLATTDRFVRHIGNVMTDEFRQKAAELDLSTEGLQDPPTSFLDRLARRPRTRSILSRVYTRLFWALSNTAETAPVKKDRT